ncbi:putative nucleotidyltransferase [compost metagenome]
MARGNYRTYLQGSEVKIKKYFYVLRPLLACAWIEKYNEVPPLEFSVLVDELIPADTLLRETVNSLLIRKMSGDELNLEPRLEVINTYLEQQIAYFEEAASRFGPGGDVPYEVLDGLFRTALVEVWGEDSSWTAGVSRGSGN